MSEARARRNSQFTSSIFGGDPTPEPQRPRSNLKRYESSSLLSHDPSNPPESQPKKATFAHKQYTKRSEAFEGMQQQAYFYKDQPKPRADPLGMETAGRRVQSPWDSSARPRTSNTLRSQIFEADSEPKPRASPYKPSDSSKLLGQDEPDFYRKTRNGNDPQGTFEPKFDSMSAYERRQKEFYGYSPIKKGQKEPVQTTENLNHKQRKETNLHSSFFDSPKRPERPDTPKENYLEEKPIYSPEKRREEMSQSFIFSDQAKYSPLPKQEIHDDTNTYERRKNHLFSDLFGSKNYNYQKPSEKLMPSNYKWISTDSKHRSENPPNAIKPKYIEEPPRITQPVSSRDYKQQFLKSSYQEDIQPAASEPKLVELQLTGLPSSIKETDLKKICQSSHIVSSDLDYDTLTGTCKGTGRIKVRVSGEKNKELMNLELSLAEKGVDMRETQSSLGKNSGNERRHPTPEVSARYNKLKNLESSNNIFGNVGKWGHQWKETSKRNGPDSTFYSQIQWNHIKNPRQD